MTLAASSEVRTTVAVEQLWATVTFAFRSPTADVHVSSELGKLFFLGLCQVAASMSKDAVFGGSGIGLSIAETSGTPVRAP